MNKSELLEKIIIAMNSKISTDELLNYLIDNSIKLTNGISGSIMLINPETNILDIKVFRGLRKNIISHTKLKIGEGVTGKVAETGDPLLINDVEKINFYVRINPNLKSELAVPLKLKDKVIGVISIDSDKKNNFSEDDLNLMMTISNIAAQILSRAFLLESLERKLERQKLLIKFANIIEKNDNLKKLFEQLMELLSNSINIKRGMLVLLDEKNKLKIFAGYKISEDAIKKGIYEIGEGITGKTVKYGKPIAIKNIFESKEFLNKMKIKRNKNHPISFISVPIKYQNNSIGVLSIEKPFASTEEFNEDLNTFIIISTLISNKVEHYEKIRKEKERLIQENLRLQNKIKNSPSISFIGKNREIEKIRETIELISDTNASVLITGETGTGKEIVARIIHFSSNRWDKPFISINCAAIPDNLLESELFGYVKGAFTGAVTNKKGKFQIADGGTIFLDEIGDMSINLQAKLLRVLQEKIIHPLGSEKDIKIDVRIIAATNQNLTEKVNKNEFRHDLFYRLNVISIHLPSLKERQDDIPLLINFFIEKFNKEHNKKIKSISKEAMNILLNYNWPGNIRELENVIERAVILTRGDIIEKENLPPNITGENYTINNKKLLLDKLIESELSILSNGKLYYGLINKIEKKVIEYALIKSNYKQIEAAEILGIHRNTLRKRIKELQIDI